MKRSWGRIANLHEKFETVSNRRVLSLEFQPAHRTGSGREPVRFKPHSLQHADEQVGQWVVPGPVEGQMLTVLESTAGENHWHVCGGVLVRVAKIAAVEHHASIEKRSIAIPSSLQLAEHLGKQ